MSAEELTLGHPASCTCPDCEEAAALAIPPKPLARRAPQAAVAYRCPGCQAEVIPGPSRRHGPHKCVVCGRSSWRLLNRHGRKVTA